MIRICICILDRRMVIRLELSNDQDPHNYDPTVDIQLVPAIQPALLYFVGRHCTPLLRSNGSKQIGRIVKYYTESKILKPKRKVPY